ncbi:MAG: hypothetical protein EBU90_01305 [Proteobacteria bacterium]|nr:hypothetical protein [Pseudomonadota bacterium]
MWISIYKKIPHPFLDEGLGLGLFFVLLCEGEEVLNLVVVVEADHEHGIVLIMVDDVCHTDLTRGE